MALNRSDKSRILRRYFPGMTRNSEMSTEPRECRQFKNIGLQASVSVIPAKAGTRNPVAGKYAFAANGLWIPAFAGMTVNMTTLPGSQLNCCSWAMISSLSARSDAEVFPMYSH